MSRKKAKRYTDTEKKEILDFIAAQGRGGQTAAVKKYKVTAATIGSWKKKMSGGQGGNGRTSGGSKELKVLQELTSLLAEIEATEKKLVSIRKRYNTIKSNL